MVIVNLEFLHTVLDRLILFDFLLLLILFIEVIVLHPLQILKLLHITTMRR